MWNNVHSAISIRHTKFCRDRCVVSLLMCSYSSCLQKPRQHRRQDRPVWLLSALTSSPLRCPGAPLNRTCSLNTLTQTAQRLYRIRTRALTRTQVCRSPVYPTERSVCLVWLVGLPPNSRPEETWLTKIVLVAEKNTIKIHRRMSHSPWRTDR